MTAYSSNLNKYKFPYSIVSLSFLDFTAGSARITSKKKLSRFLGFINVWSVISRGKDHPYVCGKV